MADRRVIRHDRARGQPYARNYLAAGAAGAQAIRGAYNHYNAARGAWNVGQHLGNGIRDVANDVGNRMHQYFDRDDNAQQGQSDTTQDPPSDDTVDAKMDADGAEQAGTGGVTGQTEYQQFSKKGVKSGAVSGPHSEINNNEFVISGDPIMCLPQAFFPFIWSERMKKQYEANLIRNEYTHYSLQPAKAKLYNLCNYTINTVASSELVQTKTNNNYNIITSFSRDKLDATTFIPSDSQGNSMVMNMDNKMEFIPWDKLYKVRGGVGAGNQVTENPYEGWTAISSEASPPNPVACEPKAWFDGDAPFQDNQVFTTPKTGGSEAPWDYRRGTVKAAIGMYEDRDWNYTTSGTEYGITKDPNIFLGQASLRGPGLIEDRAINIPGVISCVDPQKPIDWSCPTPGGHIPFFAYYWTVIVDTATGNFVNSGVSNSPNRTLNTVQGQEFCTFGIKPWQFVVNNLRQVLNGGTNTTITGKWTCMDAGSTLNVSKSSTNMFLNYASQTGRSRSYQFFQNSKQLDKSGTELQELISAWCSMECGVTFHKNRNNAEMLQEDDDTNPPTEVPITKPNSGMGSLITAGEKYTIPPLREITSFGPLYSGTVGDEVLSIQWLPSFAL